MIDPPGVDPEQCKWCGGTGVVSASLAYVPGPEPFGARGETAYRPTTCGHCRGTGEYASAQDPALDWDREE
jgi:DnaJ-class molecular chaperone